jgi:hypothetical protein
LGSQCHIIFSLSLKPVFPVLCHCCTVGQPHSSSGQFTPESSNSPGPNFPEDISLVPCHSCTAGHLPAGGSQLPLGSTISSGQFLLLSTSLCSLLPASMPLLPSFDRLVITKEPGI